MPEVGTIAVTGKTIDKIIESIYEAVDSYIETSEEFGTEIPEQLQGEYVLTFELAEAPLVHRKHVEHPKSVQVATA